jgi:glutamine amidotransferase
MSLVIVDYGVGNLGSVGRALRRLGVPYELSASPETIESARQLILPGVGHFGESMTNLRERGLEAPLKRALSKGAHLLGICVGFQMLFERSEEAPGVAGLGVIEGEVKRFPEDALVPHIGWNQLESPAARPLLRGVRDGDYFYFLHSFYVAPSDPASVWARTDYGVSFCSVGGTNGVAGIQFHPEKSQRLGLEVLKNFAEGG